MDVALAAALVSENLNYADRFYGTTAEVTLGAGALYRGIRFPTYDPDRNIFVTRSGLVCVLTHECDVEVSNSRPFNDDVLICPIIDLGAFVQVFSARYSNEDLRSYLGHLASRRIMQLVCFPGMGDVMPYGGVVFLNQITHTKANAFMLEGAELVGAVSAYGLEVIDQCLRRHLFRPKADRLSFMPPNYLN